LNRMKGYYEGHGIPLDRIRAFWSSILAAPVHIFAFSDISVADMEKKYEKIEMIWSIQAVSAACQNMLLTIHALGLGAVWTGAMLIVEEDIKAMLGVPQEVQLMTVIAVGYTAQEPLPPVRKPLSDVMFFEKWEKK